MNTTRTFRFKLLGDVDERPAWIEAVAQSKVEAVKLKAEAEARAPAEKAAVRAYRQGEREGYIRAKRQRDPFADVSGAV